MSLRKVYSLVPPARRRRLPRVLLSALCSAVVDLVGIAALVSILLLVLDENIIATNPLVGRLYDSLGFATEGQFIGAVCLVVLLLKLRLYIPAMLLCAARVRQESHPESKD